MMAIRLVELRRVLKPDGSIYLHCDPTAGHYLRMLMDAVFGAERWQAQITWKRTSAHSDSSTFGSVCDLILFYGASGVNTDEVRVPLDPEYVARHYRFTDERGQYRHDNLTGPLHNQKRGVPSTEPWRGYDVFAAGRCWSVPRKGAYAEFIDREIIPGYRSIESIHARLDALAEADLIYWPKKAGGMPSLKRYLHANPGQALSNLWDDIPPLNKQAAEATGFDTQKPLALLKRIIQASSNEGDLVLDPFCGCGTAVVAAHDLNRRWVGIDITHLAVGLMEQRLHALAAEPRVIGAPTSAWLLRRTSPNAAASSSRPGPSPASTASAPTPARSATAASTDACASSKKSAKARRSTASPSPRSNRATSAATTLTLSAPPSSVKARTSASSSP